jgi:hypothetical protein
MCHSLCSSLLNHKLMHSSCGRTDVQSGGGHDDVCDSLFGHLGRGHVTTKNIQKDHGGNGGKTVARGWRALKFNFVCGSEHTQALLVAPRMRVAQLSPPVHRVWQVIRTRMTTACHRQAMTMTTATAVLLRK